MTQPSETIFKNEDNRWVRYCPFCGETVSHARKNYCVGADSIKQPCIKCSNTTNKPSGMIGAVRLAWFEAFRKSALTRGYVWELTPEFISTMYDEQQGRCALSDIPINWSTTGWTHTASIDRIDNSLGYMEHNVQLVHKKVNMLRGSLSVSEFIELCDAVSDKNKTKW